ncbi:MauE/DoxX family redox-associated membrane protein [Nocardia sp. IFM 10818]
MDLVLLVGRVVLVVVVGGAGVVKLGARDRFTQAIVSYELVSDTTATLLGRWLPIAEIAAAVLLVTGVGVVAAALFVVTCLISFAVAMTVNLIRGRRIECGCSGSRSRRISWMLVIRNLFLAGVAGIVAVLSRTDRTHELWTANPTRTVPETMAVILATCGALLCLVLVTRAYQLRGQTHSLHELTSPRRKT